MKKYIPFLAISGISLLALTGCESNLTAITPVSAEVTQSETEMDFAALNEANYIDNYEVDIEIPEEYEKEEQEYDEDAQGADEEETLNNAEISTLYTLCEDVNNSCNAFCQLKQELINAIIETQNLIEKLHNNEITLTTEERMCLNDQAMQLKTLSRQLGNSTTELSFCLSNLYQSLSDENINFNDVSLKYLIVLDNLINGNEMLNNGLYSLNLVNSMLLNNANGRLRYGYQHNNQTPIYKDYSIENGKVTENQIKEEDEDATLVDSYKNSRFKSNIDTYGNRFSNIDSFFNTAWLDNDFMFGSNGYGGYGMPYGGAGFGMRNAYAPYVENNKIENNTTNSVDNTNNTPQVETLSPNKEKKKFKLQKNIDTYRDANTPTVSAKLTVIKNSISNFFDKFKDESSKNELREKINEITD